MADFLDEVREEVRQEQLLKLVRRFAPYIAGALLAFVIGSSSYSWYRSRVDARNAEAGQRYLAALEMLADNPEKALPIFDEVISSGDGYGHLATLKKAALLAQEGKQDEAVALYDTLVANPSADLALRDLAGLRAAYILYEHKKDVKKSAPRLTLLAEPGRPWRYMALELLAAQAIDAGKKDEAKKLLREMKDTRLAPAGMRERAEKLLEALGEKPGDDK